MDCLNWAAEEYARITAPEEKEAPPVTLGEAPPVTDPGPLHLPYSVLGKPQNTVPWPEPYHTLDDENTYIDFMDYLDDESVAWMDENYDATPQTIMLESIRDDIFCQTN